MITEIERRLQSLIDQCGHNIAVMEYEQATGHRDYHKNSWKTIRESQSTLKRTMAELIALRRLVNTLVNDPFEVD